MRLACFNVLMLVFATSMTGCVNEVKSKLSEKFDRDVAVHDSVAAAMAYMQEGHYPGAHRHLKRAHGFSPNSAQVFNAYALLYRVEGDLVREEEHYLKAIEADPSFSTARNNYAGYLFSQTRYQEAADQLSIVVEDIRYNQRYRSFESLGRCLLKLDQPDKAREAFFRSVRLNNAYYPSWLQLVEISIQAKAYNAARSQLASYEKVGPKTLQSLKLGEIIGKLSGNDSMRSDYSQKIADFKKSVSEKKVSSQSAEAMPSQKEK